MLTCIARPKKLGDDSLSQPEESDSTNTPGTKTQAIKSLTSQPVHGAADVDDGGGESGTESTEGDGRVGRGIGEVPVVVQEDGELELGTRVWGKEMEARLKGISSSSGEGTPSSASGRRVEPVVLFVEESEPKEWVAQVEPGVLITFVSLPRGGNDLKRIRFR
ncbi:protein brevis radix-like 4 [Quercus suber]|uniref:Protein brevis radix-like 4 n=1 Tax=Quercus suber TaxID=58331 RepID=A0AAW0LHV2_QUESU